MNSSYSFTYSNVLPPGLIWDAGVCNRFDLMIVGGGGLLSHSHPPLDVEGWQREITIPIAIFGIGADRTAAIKSKMLIEKAVYVSGRDVESTLTLSDFRSDVRFVPDPVLGHGKTWANAIFKRISNSQRYRVLWVLRWIDGVWSNGFHRLIDFARDAVCFLEPALDYMICLTMPAAIPIYCLEELLVLMDNSDLVVSMRYHGCIISMIRGVPTVGIREEKILSLFTRYGNDAFFFRDVEGLQLPALDSYVSPDKILLEDEILIQREMATVLRLIPKSL